MYVTQGEYLLYIDHIFLYNKSFLKEKLSQYFKFKLIKKTPFIVLLF